MKNNSSRSLAYEVLKKVFINKSFSNILLNEISTKEIDEKFKNLVFAIVHGTITYKIYLEYLTNKLIDPRKTPIEIKIILWMSVYQLKFLTNVPRYAVLNEAVELAKSVNTKFAGFVNACLQKVIRDEETFFDVKINNTDQKFCVEYAFPFELFKMISNDYGIDIAKSIVKDSINKPTISFRVNTLLISVDEFYQQYKNEYGLEKTFVTDGLNATSPIVKSKMFNDGLITIQDLASILVAQTLAPSKDSRVLDMCSAPGGKLTHLAALMQNTGELIGYEISQNKISLIESNLKRLQITNTKLICNDATSINDEKGFDYILLDAPCSGFGVLKRKPEIKLDIDFKAVNNIVNIQSNLLDTAYKNLKVGGTMVYSTCTINKSENQDQITEFTNKYKNMEIISENQLFGSEHNTDGFYICKMIKK